MAGTIDIKTAVALVVAAAGVAGAGGAGTATWASGKIEERVEMQKDQIADHEQRIRTMEKGIVEALAEIRSDLKVVKAAAQRAAGEVREDRR